MLLWKYDYDAKLWHHKQRTSNTNDHHMPLNNLPPHEKLLRTPLAQNDGNSNSKEPHFLFFYHWESDLLVRSHGTAQVSGETY